MTLLPPAGAEGDRDFPLPKKLPAVPQVGHVADVPGHVVVEDARPLPVAEKGEVMMIRPPAA